MSEVAEIARLIVRLTGDGKLYADTLKNADKQTSAFVRDANGYFRDLQGKFVSVQEVMRSQASTTIQKLNAFGMHLKDLGGIAGKVGGQFKSMGSYLSLRLTAPIVAAGTLGAREFLKYNEALTQTKTLVGFTAAEMEKFDAAIIAMSPKVARGPVELADALYFITGAGFQGQAALDILGISAKAAAAGLGETKVVADAVTSAVNAYTPEVLSASRATDILAAAVKYGKMEASELAPVLGQIMPTAAAMKVSFADVAGAMAVMSRTGLNSAESAVSLQAVLSTLLKPSKEGAKLLDDYKLDMGQLRDMARGPGGLIQVMRLLSLTFADNDEALAQIIPNVRAFRGVMNILAQDGKIVDEVMEGVANSVGFAEAAFQGGEDSPARQWARAMAELKVAMVELGRALVPVLAQIGNVIRGLSQWFIGLDADSKSLVITLAGLAAGIGPVLIAMGALISVVAQVVTAFGTLIASEAGLAAMLKMLPYLGTAAAAFGAALAGLAAVIIYNLHPATQKFNDELERMRRLQQGIAESVGKSFQADLGGKSGSLEIQREAAKTAKENAEAGLAAQQRVLAEAKRDLSNDSGASNFLWSNQQAVKGDRARIDEARAMIKLYQDQVNQATEAVERLAKAKEKAAIVAPPKVRPPEIKALMDELRGEADKFGMSEGKKQIYDLTQTLAKEGEKLNEQELQKLNALDKELVKLKEIKKAEDERKRAYEHMAKQAVQYMEKALTPIEELRKQFDEIDKLWQNGALNDKQWEKVRNNLLGEFMDKQGTYKPTAGAAVEAGTREGYSLTHFGTVKPSEKAILDLVKKADVQITVEKDILRAIQQKNVNNILPTVAAFP